MNAVPVVVGYTAAVRDLAPEQLGAVAVPMLPLLVAARQGLLHRRRSRLRHVAPVAERTGVVLRTKGVSSTTGEGKLRDPATHRPPLGRRARLRVPSGGMRRLDGEHVHRYGPRQRRSGRHGRVGLRVPVPTAPQSVTSAPAGSGDTATTTTVVARAVQGVGSVVTDDKGMTLYRYDKDQANPSKWTCAGECTKTWIPVIVQDSVQTTGVEKSLLGTVHRNGEKQLTLGGWPLYRYVGDTQAGQLNGQAKGGMWYAVTPSGAKSTTTG